MTLGSARSSIRNCFLVLLLAIVSAACRDLNKEAVQNNIPAAFPGGDQEVAGGALVTLSGSGLDADDDVLTFVWTQVGGDTVALSSTTASEVTFVAPELAQTLVFSLTVSDGFDDSPSSLVRVVVSFNRPPVADSGGPQQVLNLASVTLDGSGSADSEGAPLTFQWVVEAGPPTSVDLATRLSGATSKYAVFTPDKKGDYTIYLLVSDGLLPSDKNFAVITALNNPPVADAGTKQSKPNTQPVDLQGFVADADGDTSITWQWAVTAFPPGATFSLINAATDAPTLTTGGKGGYIVSLVVSDGDDFSAPSEVIVQATNNEPTANAGADDSGDNASPLPLFGSGTDDDFDVLTYQWTVTGKPSATDVFLLEAASTPSPVFTPRGVGTWTLTLVVSDGTVQTCVNPATQLSCDTVEIQADNNPPVANAGDDRQGLNSGQQVTLDGSSSSDIDGHALTYSWNQKSGPVIIEAVPISGTATPTITPPDDVKGTIVMALTVTDPFSKTHTDLVQVTVDNLRPVALGTGTGAVAGLEVTLDGSASFDPDNEPVALWTWNQISGPTVAEAMPLTGATPVFTAPAHDPNEPSVTFELVVGDGKITSVPATIVVPIMPDDGSFKFVSAAGTCTSACNRSNPYDSFASLLAELPPRLRHHRRERHVRRVDDPQRCSALWWLRRVELGAGSRPQHHPDSHCSCGRLRDRGHGAG